MNCHIQDFTHPPGQARGIHVVGAIEGFEADVSLWGFEHNGDVFLKIDSAAIQGVHVTIRGNSKDSVDLDGTTGFDPNNIARYVDIPSDWDGTKNSITLIDEATNTTVSAVGGTAY
jgi:hypothetical protein